MDGCTVFTDGLTNLVGLISHASGDGGGGGLTYRSQIVEAILSGHLVGEFSVNALTKADQERAGEHWLITAANNTCHGPHTDARMHLREEQQWQYHSNGQHAKVQESPCSSDAPCI